MRIIMCRPDFFDITYVLSTNRWMDLNVRPDHALAMRQWEGLFDSYRRYGINVTSIRGQPFFNDMAFIANAGLPLRDCFILSNFFHEERMGELPFLRRFFGSRFRLAELPGDLTFEGQGDSLLIKNELLLVGCGIRTSENAIEPLSAIVKRINPAIKVIPLFLRRVEDYLSGEHIFYHLDTCLLYLEKINMFLVYPRAFQSESISVLKRIGPVVEVTKEEAECFVCNSVVAGDVIFIPETNSDWLKDFLKSGGYRLVEHNMSEFIKSGGAIKCLSLEMYG